MTRKQLQALISAGVFSAALLSGAAYADEASRPLQLSALTDQQLAAGIMWVPGSIAYTIAIVLVAYRMLEPRSARGDGRTARALPTGVG